MKRIFIAIKIEPENTFLKIYSSLRTIRGDEKINWVDLSNIHLTLAFLGDTEEGRIKVVAIMLKQQCSGFGEFDFNLSGAGVFKNFRDPRVIWFGIGNSEKLVELYAAIKTGLEDAGFKTEDRSFRPHITIGRIKYIKNTDALKAAIENYRDSEIQKITAKEVILYESVLKSSGPVYKPVGIFSLR